MRRQQEDPGRPARPLHHKHRDADGRLPVMPLLLLVVLLALPRALAIQFDVLPYFTRCIMDEYAPEEESALKLRAVGRVQEGVRATVRASDMRYAHPLGVEFIHCPGPPRTKQIGDRPGGEGGVGRLPDGGRAGGALARFVVRPVHDLPLQRG